MRTVRIVAALALMLGFDSAEARIVAIQNASFETPPLADNNFVFGVPSWTTTGQDTGVFNPPVAAYPAGAPDGQNVAFISTGSAPSDALAQTLTETLQAQTIYTLRAAFGVRADGASPTGGSVALEFYAGSTLLGSATPTVPAPGTFTTATVNFVTGATHPNLGQPLQVRLVGNIPNGGQFNFDNVVLQANALGAVPTLDSASLAVLAALMLIAALVAVRRSGAGGTV